MRATVLVLAAWALATHTHAEAIDIDSTRWRARGTEAQITEHHGRRTLFLREATARLEGLEFATGVIEFDLLTDGRRSFPGVRFRGQDDNNFENFYIRPHQSGNPDANQYQPVFNNSAGWQIYYGPAYSAPTRYRLNEWMRVRIEVAEDSARIYIDTELILTVDDLKRDRRAGFVALSDPGGGAYFSNVVVTPGVVASGPVRSSPEMAVGTVTSWQVSPALPLREAHRLASTRRFDEVNWATLAVETNGIANLARVAAVAEQTSSVIARFRIHADRRRDLRLRFGFSDTASIYLNGRLLYDGDDTNSTRDYRFLGTVGLFDALHLPLRRGDNDVVFVVTENFGGWAVSAVLDAAPGIALIDQWDVR